VVKEVISQTIAEHVSHTHIQFGYFGSTIDSTKGEKSWEL